MPSARKAAYALFAALVLGTYWLHFGAVVLAALFAYLVLDAVHRRIPASVPKVWARAAALLAFAFVSVGMAWLFGRFVRLAVDRLPAIFAGSLPRLCDLAARHGVELPVDNMQDLRAALLGAIKDHAASITQASGLLTKGFFQIIIGVVAALLCFLTPRPAAPRGTFYWAVREEFDGRMAIFMDGFHKIFSAQATVSLINTGITAVWILIAGVPYVQFLLLATFMFGMIPVIGTLISDAMILAAALMVSPRLALWTAAFLLASHKAQYFLTGRILGSRLKTPMWQILIGLMAGEAVMGVPGMLIAPALIHYVREELRGLPEDLGEGQADARRAKAALR